MHISHIPLREYVTGEHYSQQYIHMYHYSATAARYVQQTGDVKRKILTSNTLAHIINVQVIFKGENQLFDVLIYIYQYSSGEQKI